MPLFEGYLAYAPFPEGFQGDLDETFQQSGQLATIYISGNFLSGLYYPNGTTPPPTLPTSDQGPIALNGVWYFWDPVTGQYLAQSSTLRASVNYCKNPTYQIAQLGNTFTLSAAGVFKTFDMALGRVTQAGVLSVSGVAGPPATADHDACQNAINYTVGPTLVPTLAATDLFAHEHLVEGSDVAMAQGEVLSLSFSVWTNVPGTYSAYLTSSGRDASYVFSFTVTTANQWARIKINNIPALPTTIGTWQFGEGQTALYLGIVLGVGAQYRTPTPDQWIAGFFAGTAANTNLLTVVNNQIQISAIKLEASPTCTYCTVKSFEGDFHDAIRYYWTSFNYQVVNAGTPMAFIAAGTTAAYGSIIFPRRMCRTPTVVPYSTVSPFTAGNVYDINSAANIAVANLVANPKGTGGAIVITGTKGDVLDCFVTADARLS